MAVAKKGAVAGTWRRDRLLSSPLHPGVDRSGDLVVLLLLGIVSVEVLLLKGSSRSVGGGDSDGCRGPVGDETAELGSPVGGRRGHVVVEGSRRSPRGTVRRPYGAAEVGADVDGVGGVAVGLRGALGPGSLGVALDGKRGTSWALSDGGDNCRLGGDHGHHWCSSHDRAGDVLTTFLAVVHDVLSIGIGQGDSHQSETHDEFACHCR
ncbi:hypothetical protein PMAYCL1PPCAC_07838 [Pristionchus mayeri]|uniref:Uncharacterized protein n=1 Tax=Pristionchus mayeri TaxID=1317129 RepID=A0AAN4ZAN5_9BILA|nr:hypothetical protein PMAYCL1PPCAC_07838 [Pristionchus mayeri]